MTFKSGDRVRIKNRPDIGVVIIDYVSNGERKVIIREDGSVYRFSELMATCKLNRDANDI